MFRFNHFNFNVTDLERSLAFYKEALGLEPEAVRTAPLPDALAEGAWDQTALELAWEWGLLPEDAGSAAEIARVQGGAMADAFAALL